MAEAGYYKKIEVDINIRRIQVEKIDILQPTRKKPKEKVKSESIKNGMSLTEAIKLLTDEFHHLINT